MPTVTKPRPRRKVSRKVRLYPSSPALLELTIGQEVFDYLLLPIPCELGGLGFELRKPLPDGTVYHVRLDGQQSTCTCPGFERWGMGKDGEGCKHIASLEALRADGRLPRLPARQEGRS